MRATTVERPQSADATRASTRPDAPGATAEPTSTDEWRDLMRALAATDDDELPVFGRFPA
jgi:hypothetical protein